ncbi:TPA: bifunctional DNA-formamidopyrimidine glycosylase/DNA-(apurinic or apyrimidinic site) lyase [Candidatus Falkowbacteria bacterium]|nr:MAG: Formamidopyrimidine-DNA glycosylase [Candidatus Falkowbacteria bacterium GW2011_GWF2_43_32]HBA36932.1 bifunctional DNA-formamidopyrimidine glycosylase/DNA-(apurinic or apyrimidinic site) lyase [Candidatus Falkowbacteria bacterium]
MPELPEVETIRRDLAAKVVGRKIMSVHILSPKSAAPNAVFLKKNLLGRKIIRLERRGKLLIFALSPSTDLLGSKSDSADYLLIHLKMTGQLIYVDKKDSLAGGHSLSAQAKSLAEAVGGTLPNRHTRAIIGFSQGARLFFNDLRRFGYLKLVGAAELAKILQNNYGPEPLTAAFSLTAFQSALTGRKTKIKALLLNQKIIAGLGNIYADETLWLARIHPERRAGALSAVEAKKLWRAINRIIGRAIEYRGTTFNNYVDAGGRQGNFFGFLKVYGRAGKRCPACRTTIVKSKIVGRGTHYCPHCQI